MGTSSSRFEKCLRHGDEFAAMQLYQGSAEVRRKLRPNGPIDNLGNTPLHWAARHGMKHLLRALLNDLEGDPNVRNSRLQTALHAVCDAPFHKSPSAIERRAFSVVLVLSWRRRNLAVNQVNNRQSNSNRDVNNRSSVRTQINAIDVFGATALHYAVKSGLDQRCLTYLLAHGADPHIRNVAGFTPYDLALRSGLTHLARFLESKMVNISEKSVKSVNNVYGVNKTSKLMLVNDTSFVTDDQVGEEALLCDLCFAILGPGDEERQFCGHALCRTCLLRSKNVDLNTNKSAYNEFRCPVSGCRRQQHCLECEQLRVRRGEKALTLDRVRTSNTSSSWWTMSKTKSVMPISAPPIGRVAVSDDDILASVSNSRSVDDANVVSDEEHAYAEVSVEDHFNNATFVGTHPQTARRRARLRRQQRVEVDSDEDQLEERHELRQQQQVQQQQQQQQQVPQQVPQQVELRVQPGDGDALEQGGMVEKPRSASLNVQHRNIVPYLRLGETGDSKLLEVSGLRPALSSAPPFSATTHLLFTFPDTKEEDDNNGFHEMLIDPKINSLRGMVSMV